MRKKRRKQRRSRNNPAALIALLLLIIIGFIFPLASASLFGETLTDPGLTVMNNIFPTLLNPSSENIVPFIMMLSFTISFILYLLSGLGVLSRRYYSARVASYLLFVYLIVGLYWISSYNRELAMPGWGNTLGGVSIGAGLYLPAIVGFLYLICFKRINKTLRL